MPPGYLVVVVSSPEHPADWVSKVVEVTGLDGVYAPEVPEPEYVDINEDNMLIKPCKRTMLLFYLIFRLLRW